MAFTTSTLTPTQIKALVIDAIDDDSIENSTVINAINHMLSIYSRMERMKYPKRWEVISPIIALSSTGYDLNLLLDLGSDTEGFKVYLGDKVSPMYEIGMSSVENDYTGYYINNNKLYFVSPPTTAHNIRIVYLRKRVKLLVDSNMNSVIPIDIDAEMLVEEFIIKRFFKKIEDAVSAREAEASFQSGLIDFFASPSRTVFLT